jgi:membrane protein implicated in regulation of membrane protease activity
MAGGVSLVLVGLICALWVLVGEFTLSHGFAFTMFFTAVIAVLVFAGASIVAVWESATVRRLRGRRREQQLARRRRAGRFGTDAETLSERGTGGTSSGNSCSSGEPRGALRCGESSMSNRHGSLRPTDGSCRVLI